MKNVNRKLLIFKTTKLEDLNLLHSFEHIEIHFFNTGCIIQPNPMCIWSHSMIQPLNFRLIRSIFFCCWTSEITSKVLINIFSHMIHHRLHTKSVLWEHLFEDFHFSNFIDFRFENNCTIWTKKNTHTRRLLDSKTVESSECNSSTTDLTRKNL